MMMKVFLVSVAGMLTTNVYAAGPVSFAQCGVCHAVTKGASSGIGPNLAGVFGRKAGALAGYQYSPALKASKLTWDAATLNKWIANPMKLVPGNKMPYAGQADPAKQAEIIAYLKTLK